MLYPVGAIWADDEDRQRSDLPNIPELAASISAVGLINPVMITSDGKLIAGRRRLEAVRSLGWLEIPVTFKEDADEKTLQLIELEENVKRVDLPWQDQVNAVVKLHTLLEAGQEETAKFLGVSVSYVSRCLLISKAAAAAPDLKVTSAENFSTAYGLAQRWHERRTTNAVSELLSTSSGKKPEGAKPPAASDKGVVSGKVSPNVGGGSPASVGTSPEKTGVGTAEIINADFHNWVRGYGGPRFNLLHCDFPYGINTGSKKQGYSGTKRLGSYADSPDIYFRLLADLLASLETLTEPQCHIVFWHHPRYVEETRDAFREAGLTILDYPLIWWKSDNAGAIPDPQRGPRNVYEMALLASRGDRKIVRPVSNLFGAPSPKTLHAHQKNHDMLMHFFRMLVDDSTVMLDPTCGSGSAVKACRDSGAKFSLGLELNEEFAERARGSL